MTTEEANTPSGTTARTILVLQILAEAANDISIKDLSQQTNLAPSTLHRLLQLLRDMGMARFDPDLKRYGIGPEFVRLAGLVSSRRSLADIARPYLERVTEKSGETSCLISFMRERLAATTLAVVYSPHPLQYKADLFTTHHLLQGTTGQSILAFLPEAEQMRIFQDLNGMEVLARLPQIPDKASYFARLKAFKAQGYASTRGESIEGAVGFGMPIYDRSGQVFGSLCVTLPALRYTAELEAKVLAALAPEATAMSRELGFNGGS